MDADLIQEVLAPIRHKLPHCQQVFQIERVRTLKGKTSTEVVCGAASLSAQKADPQRLFDLIRGHWAIENGCHYVRDTLFDEDRSAVRTRNGPRAKATFCNLATSILRIVGYTNMAKATREVSAKRSRVIQLLRL